MDAVTTSCQFVEVAVPLGVRKTFTYSVPPVLKGNVAIGARVLVPLGRKLLTGYVVAVAAEPPAGDFKIRAIRELLDSAALIPPALVQTAMWTAESYFTAPGEVLRALLPIGTQVKGGERLLLSRHTLELLSGGLRPPGLRAHENLILDALHGQGPMTLRQIIAKTKLRTARRWIDSLVAAGYVELEAFLARPRVAGKQRLSIRALETSVDALECLTPHQRRLYSLLEPDRPPQSLQGILRSAGCTPAVARSLERKGLVAISPLAVHRLPVELSETPSKKTVVLTESQRGVFDKIRAMLTQREPRRCLLHGVTGSGKTEIYLRLMAEVVSMGETALLLVPEIALTPLLSRIALSHFPAQVALMHSGMSPGERYDEWNRIKSGAARIVLGTRSAVFAPVERLRLIILDEEQDPSYKQDESPCYHAREVAWQRVQQSGGILLLGSATPSIESYYSAQEAGDTCYFSLRERVEARPLPHVTIVDMGVEFQRYGKKTVISHLLRAELAERHRRREQAILLLNRRGYARMLLCRSCGHVLTCPDCSISMTYHQEEGCLVCHYCGLHRNAPDTCAECGGEYIYFVGVGTEQLEEILRTQLPSARVARVDRDTARRRGALRNILTDFAEGKLDILVGTQMVAKGHDFPNVTLVGVFAADAGLSFPDFRSAERTFQLLTQVAGRAGRGEVPGQVIIQSFYPEHYAIRCARNQDYTAFYRQEIEFRSLMGYPPFKGLVQILVADADSTRAFRIGDTVGAALKQAVRATPSSSHVRVLGPAAAPLEKLRGKYRVQLLIKADTARDALPILKQAFTYLGEHKVALKNILVDVDPLSLL